MVNSDQCHHERALAPASRAQNSRQTASGRCSTMSNQPRGRCPRAARKLAQPTNAASFSSAGLMVMDMRARFAGAGARVQRGDRVASLAWRRTSVLNRRVRPDEPSMPHASPLVAVLVVGLGLAFVFGTVANRLKLSPIVGYLLAGVAIGPFTPGFVADPKLTLQLAEIGVVLLMFGGRLHFSPNDLVSVRASGLPGALLQVAASTLLGAGIGWLLGWRPAACLVFGLALAIASTDRKRGV